MPDQVEGSLSIDEVMKEARRNLQQSDEVFDDFQRAEREHWRALAGPLLDDMLKSRSGAERHLEHRDPKVRIAALSVLSDFWKPDESLRKISEHMALNDPDSEVRGVALCDLGSCYRGTRDKRIGRLLAAIVRDEQKPVSTRTVAYSALFDLCGQPLSWPGLYNEIIAQFRFPEDVNWGFVDEFLR